MPHIHWGVIRVGRHRACMALPVRVCVCVCVCWGDYDREPGSRRICARGGKGMVHCVIARDRAPYTERWSESTLCDIRSAER
jgi:hypothetical protein